MRKRCRRITAILMAVVMTALMIPIATVTVSAGQRDDIVNIAINEANTNGGYLGSKTKYNEGNGEPWCAYFVVWCARQAGIDSDIIPTIYSCSSIRTWYSQRKLWHLSLSHGGDYTPKEGDLVIFDWDKNTEDGDHIGIVTGISNGYLGTVEGNTGSGGGGWLKYRSQRTSLYPNYSRISGIAYENGYVRENSSKTDTLQSSPPKKGALLPWGSDNF